MTCVGDYRGGWEGDNKKQGGGRGIAATVGGQRAMGEAAGAEQEHQKEIAGRRASPEERITHYPYHTVRTIEGSLLKYKFK
jgi:hypothetical protein